MWALGVALRVLICVRWVACCVRAVPWRIRKHPAMRSTWLRDLRTAQGTISAQRQGASPLCLGLTRTSLAVEQETRIGEVLK